MGLLHRIRHRYLAGYTGVDYALYGLADRTPAEIRDFVNGSQMHNVLRPALNDWRYTILLHDKWLFARLMDGLGMPLPRTLGLLEPRFGTTWEGAPLRDAADLAELLARHRPAGLVAKPVAGRGARHFVRAQLIPEGPPALRIGDRRVSLDEFVGGLPAEGIDGIAGFILQEDLQQHPEIGEINPSSLNTLRVHTLLRADGGVGVSNAVLRVGRRGSPVDGFSLGGLAVRVADLERGVLGEGVSKPVHGGGSFTVHPDSGAELVGRVLPHWAGVLELSIRAAQAFPRLRSVGWDIAIAPGGAVLVEGNPDWNPQVAQAHRRGLLSGEFRRELRGAGVASPEAKPTAAMALRRLRRSLVRGLLRRVYRWSGLSPDADRRP